MPAWTAIRLKMSLAKSLYGKLLNMKLPIRFFVFGLTGVFAFESYNRPAQAPRVAGPADSASPLPATGAWITATPNPIPGATGQGKRQSNGIVEEARAQYTWVKLILCLRPPRTGHKMLLGLTSHPPRSFYFSVILIERRCSRAFQ